MHPAFSFNQYLMKRQVFALTGKLRFYDPHGNQVLFSQQKMFQLKEDIRVYSDESKSQELLYIQARQILDFSAAYDVIDSATGEHSGVLRRKGWRSLMRDEWEVLSPAGEVVGALFEDDMTRAMLRRFLLGSLLPLNYDLTIGGNRLADFKQRFNLFRFEMDIDFSMDAAQHLDRRLGIAAAVLIAIIEGRQSNY